MEVHHHPHVEKKNFKEYFLEFIMIFLAVTLGFFAENVRESFSNKEKEHHYMESLIADLKMDTLKLHYGIQYEKLESKMLDSALKIPIEKLTNINVQDTFYHYIFLPYSLMAFEFNKSNSAISQLKVGGFNIINNKSVIDSINYIYQALDVLESNTRLLETTYFDFAHAAQNIMRFPQPAITLDDPSINIIPKNKEIFFITSRPEIERLYNVIGNTTGSFKTDILEKKRTKARATQLIIYLQKQYHLEKE